MKRLEIVAVIPAYNEEYTIAKVILRTSRHVDRVIVCDDGSTDMTPSIARTLGAIVISHGHKQGKGEALKTLFKEVKKLNSDIIVSLDSDGQHNPDQIPMLTKPIEADQSDVVIGSRYIEGSEMDPPYYRRIGLQIINMLYRQVTGLDVKDTQCGFRAYSRKAFGCLIACNSKGYGIEGEQLLMVAKEGLRIVEVPISVRYNGLKRTSKKPPLLHGLDLLLNLLRLALI
jgi:glycosyltransferase involved in cell wall biosynthesis